MLYRWIKVSMPATEMELLRYEAVRVKYGIENQYIDISSVKK